MIFFLYFHPTNHIILKHVSNGSLAQLVEQLTLNQWAKGSSPLGSTIIVRIAQRKLGFFFVRLDIRKASPQHEGRLTYI